MTTSRPSFRLVIGAALALPLIVAASGCSYFRNLGSGAHLDEPRPPAHHPVNAKNRDLLVEITTDASGAVIQVEFKRASGSDAVDNYVAESIRNTWPGAPSTRALVELSYSVDKGFSDPKLISTRPAS